MESNKESKKGYAFGILIGIGLYLTSFYISSILNALIVVSAGFTDIYDFMDSDNTVSLVAILLIELTNHLFAGWLTVYIMTKYGEKNNCITRQFYSSAFWAVVFASSVVISYFGHQSGWLIACVHASGISFFGRKKIKTLSAGQITQPKTQSQEEVIPQISTNYQDNNEIARVPHSTPNGEDERTNQKFEIRKIQYCRRCGFKLFDEDIFCRNCGTKIEKELN